MIQTNHESYGLPGYVQAELLVGFGLVALLVLGLLYMVNPLSGDESDSIPAYRLANALYIYNAIERQRMVLGSFRDLRGGLPGDSPFAMDIGGRRIVGNNNGKIEAANGEKDKVFPEMFQAGVSEVKIVRIRGKNLELSWVRLQEGEKLLGEGNYFKLSGIHPLEARAYDRKFDNGSSDSGNVLYAKDPQGGVALYVKFELYK